MCVSSPHHSLHHVSLVVPQCFDGVENIHDVLLLDHLVDAADGTERSRTPSTGTAGEEEEEGGSRRQDLHYHHHHHAGNLGEYQIRALQRELRKKR